LAEEHQRREVVEQTQRSAFESWCADSDSLWCGDSYLLWCADSEAFWRRRDFSWSDLVTVQDQNLLSNVPVSNKASVAVTQYRCLSLMSIFPKNSLPLLRTTLILPRFSRSLILRSIVFQLIAVLFLLKPHFLNCRSYWPLL
jgi:hypothetical protein